MCNKVHYDDLAKKIDIFIEKGNVAIRKVSETSATTSANVDSLTKAYDLHHKESREDAKLIWENINELNGFKSNWRGIVIGVTLVFSTAWAAIILVWNYFSHGSGGAG